MQLKPRYQDQYTTLYQGDAEDIIPHIGMVDVVIADPPYSSGAASQSGRRAKPQKKYSKICGQHFHNFNGDHRSQLGLITWFSHWMRLCLNVTAENGALFCFIDWRNLAVPMLAMESAGWQYRALIPWDKTRGGCRPQRNWFNAQCEFIVCGVKGSIPQDEDGPCSAGLVTHQSGRGNRHHLTEKPVAVLAHLIRSRHSYQRILDPFAGSGSTLVAAAEMGRQSIGIEQSAKYCAVAEERLKRCALPLPLETRHPKSAPEAPTQRSF